VVYVIPESAESPTPPAIVLGNVEEPLVLWTASPEKLRRLVFKARPIGVRYSEKYSSNDFQNVGNKDSDDTGVLIYRLDDDDGSLKVEKFLPFIGDSEELKPGEIAFILTAPETLKLMGHSPKKAK
jgi:hypothetical protein